MTKQLKQLIFSAVVFVMAGVTTYANEPAQQPIIESGISTQESLVIVINSANKPSSLRHYSPSRLTGISYEAIQSTGINPSDANLAVGPDNLVLAVNSKFAIYTKSSPGTLLFETTFNDFFQGLLSADVSIFDPRAIYDQINERFIIVATAVDTTNQKAWWAIAASQSSNAIGTWRLHISDATLDGNTPTTNYADFPGIGGDGSYLYLTGNMTDISTNDFQYTKIRAFRLSEVYNGNISVYTDVINLFNDDSTPTRTIQPAHRYSSGTMQLVNAGTGASGNLTLWTFENPIDDPSITRTNIDVSPFSDPPDAEQQGTNILIDAGDVRLLEAEIGFSGTVWTTHTIEYDDGSGSKSVIRLYEINPNEGSITNEITFGNPDMYLFFPSLATDTFGNLVVQFSLSSDNRYISIAYIGRKATDSANTINTDYIIIKDGEDIYTSSNRWGDYSGTSIDPTNKHIIWMYNQYAKTGDTWGTWVASTTHLDKNIFLPLLLK